MARGAVRVQPLRADEMHCNHHHHSFPHLSRKQILLLYLAARRDAEEPEPPGAWERVATVIAGLASLVALVALGALAAFVLFALVVVIVG